MNMKWSQLKYKNLILSSVLVLGIAGVGGTIALLTSATGTLTNVFRPQSLQTKIVEVIDTETTVQEGATIGKLVQIENESTSINSAYVRARLTVTPSTILSSGAITLNTGDGTISMLPPTDGLIIDSDVETQKTTLGKWIYSASDGFFYFDSAVAPTWLTDALLVSVTIGNNLSEEQMEDFDIHIYQESVVAPEGKTNATIVEMQAEFNESNQKN